jgi:Kdo2-lipid IVA lauroyltransferase/acyltransferase
MVANALGFLILPVLRMAAWWLAWMPARLRLAMGARLGDFLASVGFRRRVVRENLEIAAHAGVPLRPESEREAFRHLGRLAVEMILLFGAFDRFARRQATMLGKEHWNRARELGRGVIFLSSHVGNWEIMAATGAHEGIDLLLVTKHLKPEWLHRAIEASRARAGVRATYEPRTFRDVLGHLKRGGTVGFVLDQYAGPPVGIRVPFFGVPVGTQTAVAILARRTGAVVLPVTNRRLPSGRFEVEIAAPVPWLEHADPDEEIALNTARYSAVMEAQVRARPEQWLWTHRRFKGELGPLRPGEWQEGRARR